LPGVESVIARGDKVSIGLETGINCDLRIVSPRDWRIWLEAPDMINSLKL
jgi:DNA polymerase/3'-5' exonuclease PolX